MRERNHYARLSISVSEPVSNSQSAECISLKMAEQSLFILYGAPLKETLSFITHLIILDLKSVLGSLKNTQKCLSPLITVSKFLFRPV